MRNKIILWVLSTVSFDIYSAASAEIRHTNQALPGVDQLTVQQETEHCVAHSTAHNQADATAILSLLEEYYGSIAASFEYVSPEKLLLYVYPSQEDFCKAMERTDCPKWYIGGIKHGAIHMVAPSNMGTAHTHSSAMRLVTQRLATLILAKKLEKLEKKPPFWLVKGLAVLATQQTPFWQDYAIRSKLYIQSELAKKDAPYLRELTPESGDVVFSHAAIAYLMHTYNLDHTALMALLIDFDQFFTRTKTTVDEFETAWRNHLQEEVSCIKK